MRIAIVAQNLVYGDGQGRINLEIARQAIFAGHQVTLVSVVVDEELIKAGATWEAVHVRRKPILFRVAHFPILANRVIDRLRSEDKIDHVIANGYTLTRAHDLNLSQFVHAAWLKSGVHGTATKGVIRRLYQEFYTRYNAFFEKKSYRAAHIVVAPSMQTFSELRKIGIRAMKIRRIPNGVNCKEFSPGPRERKELGLPEDVPMALFAGDIRTNRKGLGSVLSALAMLPTVHLAVVGKSDGSPFVEMAKQLGLESRVHFLGFRKDVPRVLRACDLFVFPSWYDPFGLVVTESAFVRCSGRDNSVYRGRRVADPRDRNGHKRSRGYFHIGDSDGGLAAEARARRGGICSLPSDCPNQRLGADGQSVSETIEV